MEDPVILEYLTNTSNILNAEGNELKVLIDVKDSSYNDTILSVLNSMRIYLFSQYESYSINSGTIYQNDTSLQDELIIHKLSFVPVVQSEEVEGHIIKLNVTGPKNLTLKDIDYGELNIFPPEYLTSGALYQLFELYKGQKLNSDFKVEKRSGADGARFIVFNSIFVTPPDDDNSNIFKFTITTDNPTINLVNAFKESVNYLSHK